jgi:hypothetical protein
MTHDPLADDQTYQPEYLKRWTMPDSYFGEVWPDYYSSGVGQSRDSDCLEQSNFVAMLAALGGESETVIVVQESHWAVGWVEWIAIHATDDKALTIADEQNKRLANYPVLDESDWSEREDNEAQEVWANCYDDKERIAYMRKHRDQFEFHDYADLIGCARGKYFCGYVSDLLC